MSLFSINTTSQYLDRTTAGTDLRQQLATQLAFLMKDEAAVSRAQLATTVAALLSAMSSHMNQISRALISQGRIFAGTNVYSKQYAVQANNLSVAAVTNMRDGAHAAGTAESSDLTKYSDVLGRQAEELESSASYYSAYTAHLKIRSDRLTQELQDLTSTYTYFTIMYSVLTGAQ